MTATSAFVAFPHSEAVANDRGLIIEGIELSPEHATTFLAAF
jgi:hypothetical protein